MRDQEDLKRELETIGTAYAESFNKQDGAGIAALYAKGGMHINPAGPRTDMEQFYQGIFRAGFMHQEASLDPSDNVLQGPATSGQRIVDPIFQSTGRRSSRRAA